MNTGGSGLFRMAQADSSGCVPCQIATAVTKWVFEPSPSNSPGH